ncbi:ubiquitin carboxyl-terminal hydrolase 34 [Podospora aff. communis PSN243]|uniref:Ubiquitin carboxyl-terminal hydrolase 34 n=1 Tax=Podospora aff. communis PSN243 TaxID=3040156 RepID=A0AAV9H8A6_9PEZI|nr:ubiquitin carboxyl-terminal hydrolase 34 [Podospora aff. communis PSN243]
MDQASNTDDSRERAVSSEPCSTRPNPFDDSDVSSRKRRRTSLSGPSRSRSVETVNSSQGSRTAGDSGPDPQSDSPMKLDSASATPTTPEHHQAPNSHLASGPRSSRVTINVRTPARRLAAIPSSPSSPVPRASASAATDSANAVHISVEEAELDMSREDTVADTPASSASEDSSPPVEIISIEADDEDFDVGEPEVMIMGDAMYDASGGFPFHEPLETYGETINRLFQYLTQHETVAKNFSEWIEGYLRMVSQADYLARTESYWEHQDAWSSVPELVTLMLKSPVNYSPHPNVRDAIFTFYKSFARLAACFVDLDLRMIRTMITDGQSRLPELASPPYVKALASLTRKEETGLLQQQLSNGATDWNYAIELGDVLDAFQTYHANHGGSLAYVKRLAILEAAQLVPRFPELAGHVAHLCLLASNLLHQSQRRLSALNDQHTTQQARSNITGGYGLFKATSESLAKIIESHINHLSDSAATTLLPALTDIYQICLATDHVASPELLQHRELYPSISPRHAPEAIAYRWKFTEYIKLIKSSQMNLRVMAASAMCTDLVMFYRKYNEPTDESSAAFLSYIADFLVETGLVSYILGPTCHPEITRESSNIIGFLVVSATYTTDHTDAMWQTVTSTEDPGVSDALLRMTKKIVNLFSHDAMHYFCKKLNTVPVEAFGPTMREFCESVLGHLTNKISSGLISEPAPYNLCIRLIRQSSVFGMSNPIAHPDLQNFAIQMLEKLLCRGPSIEIRGEIYLDCMEDVARRSRFTVGSLWVLYTMLRPTPQRELHSLTSEHNFTKLLVDEFEAVVPASKSAGFPTTLHGHQNTPRREILGWIIKYEPGTIDEHLGPRLWRLLVGPGAACQGDRDASWSMLHGPKPTENSFIWTCCYEYLPTLQPKYFCAGALKLVYEWVFPMVDDAESIFLDDEGADHAGLEQLWRMVLTAPEGTIEQDAIKILARDIYMESKCIKSFSHYRARKVHLAFVDRCLRQLSSAAARLRGSSNGTMEEDGSSMAIVPAGVHLQEQELLFIRSLSVLREFHSLYQKGHFSAPDLRSLILDPPNEPEGDPAELMYQSFDGDTQTEVKPLLIGKRNTAASLLASLREATGFSNYRIYYKGRPFVPQESDICKSLEDLRIHNGIILIKRESDVPASPTRPRAGASPVEVEILSHFKAFWEYLSMEEKMAQGIFNFLVKLPIDENTLKAIEDPTASYLDIFPPGQAFKSLYASHAIRQYLASQRRKTPSSQLDKYLESAGAIPCSYSVAVGRAMALIVPAISDHEIISQCPNPARGAEFNLSLVECLLLLLKDPFRPQSSAQCLNQNLLGRLLEILRTALSEPPCDRATKHISFCLESILESCSSNQTFMSAFCAHEGVPGILESVLLRDYRSPVRQSAAVSVLDKISGNMMRSASVTEQFRRFFWPIISGLVEPAISNGGNSTEALELCLETFRILRDAKSPILEVQRHLCDWSTLLLGYTTFEDVTQPDIIDLVASFLARLLHSILCVKGSSLRQELTPPRGVAREIFWKHLFPPFIREGKSDSRPILQTQTRGLLIEVIFSLIEGDSTQLVWLLEDLNELLPLFPEEEELYAYELGFGFERSKAIRAPCGYVGLKNLSNTCYLNSLFTQLFMNTDFRRFILSTEVGDRHYTQPLLFHTQKLFAFMQGSIRRFMTPDECVASIKTYEDTQIDIHSQMDVDEFYNLLFDRWESQFQSSEEKRQFRSFYGGQLVQQVTSKECEHISERLEPFSAIQCDIKGKRSLEESLRAYVDGEIMQGDNKYKCSTCDRHVDAVKRTCLKDIPDNLIFHLKRFDFNIRTMQRNKINEYFQFPTSINMGRYTIDHLSESSESGSAAGDVFELVGVLVHSGTAESGHYYSYVRERPSNSKNPVWVEFNDDVVSAWDPAMMADACFGGADGRAQFDSTGAAYDKNYSAYMLFYQRSTSIARDQQRLQQRQHSSPLRVDVPSAMGEYIEEENITLLRRHCLYDPSQIQFVNLALFHVKTANTDGCTREHEMETLAMTMALSHLDQVASRAKDIPDFFTLLRRISGMCQTCVRCCLAVFQYFHRHADSLRFMVQKNPDAEVRQAMVRFFMQILDAIKEKLPAQYGLPSLNLDEEESDEDEYAGRNSIMAQTTEIFKVFWENFHVNLRSWPEVFDFMLSFVKMGRYELMEFLQEPYLRYLLTIIWADPTLDLSPQFTRMITTISRRLATRPPSYEAIISLVHVLTARMTFLYNDHGEVTGPELPEQRFDNHSADSEMRYFFTRSEARILHNDWGRGLGNIFVDKLVSINQNPTATHFIIKNLMRQGRVMEEKVYVTLKVAINCQTTPPTHQNGPFLRVASRTFCRFAAQPKLVEGLISHVSEQCTGLQGPEGKAYLDFQKDVFTELHENTNLPADSVLRIRYEFIPVWGPGLLGYFETLVATEAEEFLREILFKRAPSPTSGGVDGVGDVESMMITQTARLLGLKCLEYLRETYVEPRVEVSSRLLGGLERTIKECTKFYDSREDGESEETAEFLRLFNSVTGPLRRLTVEEIEEDGSGMFYSDSSSIASSNTAG